MGGDLAKRRPHWRLIMTVSAVTLLLAAACAADDATDVETFDPPAAPATDVDEPAEGEDPTDAGEDSALARDWAAIADNVRETISEHGLGSPQFSEARDQAVRDGIGLLPAGMPVPDVESAPTAGVAPMAPHCLDEFAITLGLYHAPDRPYEFDEATEWFEAGINDAGWSAQTENLIGPGHPMAGQAEGVRYTVQTDDASWQVDIMAHFGTDMAYCPAG